MTSCMPAPAFAANLLISNDLPDFIAGLTSMKFVRKAYIMFAGLTFFTFRITFLTSARGIAGTCD